MHFFVGDSIAAGRPSNWEETRRPSFAGLYFCVFVKSLEINLLKLL